MMAAVTSPDATDPVLDLARDIDATCRLTGEFTLRSGQVAREYFDKYLFEAKPDLLARVVEQMVPLLPDGTEVLGGLELGGVPIATILSARTGLPGLFVRKKAKEYGTCKLAEGGDVSGRQVTLVEDVITTGGAVRDATNALRAEGAIVHTVVCAIDRSPADSNPLADVGLEVRSVLTKALLDSVTA
jgi:orotate phosphoribosyltransferase